MPFGGCLRLLPGGDGTEYVQIGGMEENEWRWNHSVAGTTHMTKLPFLRPLLSINGARAVVLAPRAFRGSNKQHLVGQLAPKSLFPGVRQLQ